MTTSVLPSTKNVGNESIYTYTLNSQTPISAIPDFEISLNRVIKHDDPHLIVLDIKSGEPVWLSDLLDKYNAMGIKLIVHPLTNASPGTRAALENLQDLGAISVAKRLGYLG